MELNDIHIDEEKVRRTLDKLQDNKAAGVDEINSTFLKHSIDGMVVPLVKKFQESLRTGQVPKD